jgi:hypothetical protein
MKFRIAAINVINESMDDMDKIIFVESHCEVTSDLSPGGEALRVFFVTPSFFERELGSDDCAFEFGRGYVIVREYSELRAMTLLQNLIDGLNASTWREFCTRVDRYFDVI